MNLDGVAGVLTTLSTSQTGSDADREGVEFCEALWMLTIVVINTRVQKSWTKYWISLLQLITGSGGSQRWVSPFNSLPTSSQINKEWDAWGEKTKPRLSCLKYKIVRNSIFFLTEWQYNVKLLPTLSSLKKMLLLAHSTMEKRVWSAILHISPNVLSFSCLPLLACSCCRYAMILAWTCGSSGSHFRSSNIRCGILAGELVW